MPALRLISRNLCCTGVCFVVLTGSLSLAFAGDSAPQVMSKLIAEGYLHNRESFDAFECRFRLEWGEAKDSDEAIQGRLTNRRTMQGVWLVNGEKVRLECVHAQTPSDFTKAYAAQQWLSNGPLSLSIQPDVKMGNIFYPEFPGAGILNTPFDFGMMGFNEKGSPGKSILECLKDHSPCTFEGNQDVKGRSLSLVVFKRGDYEEQIFFDLQRGFLPLQWISKEMKSGTIAHKVWITKVEECEGERWFPMRTVVAYFPPGEKSLPCQVRIYEVDHLKIGAPFDDQFVVDAEAGTSINDHTRDGAQIRLKSPRRYSLADLEPLLDTVRHQAGIESPGSSRQRSFVWLFIVVPLVVVVGSLAYRLTRRLKASKSA
jgi:hypothetical protein